jgi:hypothetical protein
LFAHSDRFPTATPLNNPDGASSLVVNDDLDQLKVGENRVVVGLADDRVHRLLPRMASLTSSCTVSGEASSS